MSAKAGCSGTWKISTMWRQSVTVLAISPGEAGMPSERVRRLLGCVVEAAGNAVKHTGGGSASVHRTRGSLIVAVSDSGPGIGAMSLPDVAFTRGYSTAGIGMGYKLMIRFADTVYLATGPAGTTVAMR